MANGIERVPPSVARTVQPAPERSSSPIAEQTRERVRGDSLAQEKRAREQPSPAENLRQIRTEGIRPPIDLLA